VSAEDASQAWTDLVLSSLYGMASHALAVEDDLARFPAASRRLLRHGQGRGHQHECQYHQLRRSPVYSASGHSPFFSVANGNLEYAASLPCTVTPA
jgi:hypothetical protein